MESHAWVVSVLLPIPVDHPFDYALPADIPSISLIGSRVLVPFGKRRFMLGVVCDVYQKNLEQTSNLKYLLQRYDSVPLLKPVYFEFIRWLSSYYMVRLGSMLKIAFPLLLAIDHKTYLVLEKPREEFSKHTFSAAETIILDALSIQPVITFGKIQSILDKKNVFASIQKLERKGLISIQNQVKRKYVESKKWWIVPTDLQMREEWIDQAFDLLATAPKQKEVFLKVISEYQTKKMPLPREVISKTFAGGGMAALKALEEKSLISMFSKAAWELPSYYKNEDTLPNLSELQQQSLDHITVFFQKKKNVLLHGVTASGKTEIYIHLIRRQLDAEKQILFLIPEIALTPQLIMRLKRHLGDDSVYAYHSMISPKARLNLIKKAASGIPFCLVGPRSAIFIPFSRLGLVIIDEEHDPSFKSNTFPYYNARDASTFLAKLLHTPLLLGTATPSFESFQNAQTGKFSLVSLPSPYQKSIDRQIRIVDLKKKKPNQIKHRFSDELYLEIKNALSQRQQILLFQNQRGFAPLIKCYTCYHVPQCQNCDVSLVYHKNKSVLICHYCGYYEPFRSHCSQCGSGQQEDIGLGTQKLEEYTQKLFPQARVARLDRDITRKRGALQSILQEFEAQEIDILVGTQMITKSLSFRNVSVMGVMDADMLLYHLDFRNLERAFQTMMQAIGRVGRYGQKSVVVVQTTKANHELFDYAVKEDYPSFYRHYVGLRKMFSYPPFLRMIDVELSHQRGDLPVLAAREAALSIAQIQNHNIQMLGPATPPIPRIKNRYIQKIIFKFPPKNLSKIKEQLQQIFQNILQDKRFRGLDIKINVDP